MKTVSGVKLNWRQGRSKNSLFNIEISIKGEWTAVTRFDTVHDAVHRDLIAPDGAVTKRWFVQFNFDEGLTFAYNDIEANWEKYREWYLSRMGR
jgi:hypothetical protein